MKNLSQEFRSAMVRKMCENRTILKSFGVNFWSFGVLIKSHTSLKKFIKSSGACYAFVSGMTKCCISGIELLLNQEIY